MALLVVEVSEPADTLHSNELVAVFINAAGCCVEGVIVRNAKFAVAATDARPKPEPARLDEWEYLSITDSIDITQDYECLVMFDELIEVFPEQ